MQAFKNIYLVNCFWKKIFEYTPFLNGFDRNQKKAPVSMKIFSIKGELIKIQHE